MNSKRLRASPSHPPLGSESEQFLWHLRRPWIPEYSHEHWWGESAQSVQREAAIWEILRRHPYSWWFLIEGQVDWDHDGAGGNWSENEQFLKECLPTYWQRRRKQFLNLIRFSSPFSAHRVEKDLDLTLSAYAYLSWAELPKREQQHWKEELEHLDSQHGFRAADEIYGAELVPDINELRRDSVRKLRRAAKLHYTTRGTDTSLEKLWEEHHCGDALGLFAGGKLLVAFDPYVPNVERLVTRKVRATVKRWRHSFPKSFVSWPTYRTGRLRIQDWLAVIKKFEVAELNRVPSIKRDDQLFARYRRVIGPWNL